jgi:hypothetical protein
MKNINKLRKFVHAVIFSKRLNKTVKEISDFCLATLKEFVNTYNYCDNSVKQFIYEGIKHTYSSVY